jgi:hypothetical protein
LPATLCSYTTRAPYSSSRRPAPGRVRTSTRLSITRPSVVAKAARER